MRILITGARGQVGQALCSVLNQDHTLFSTTHQDLDITDVTATDQIVAQQPDLVIHSAAFTNVDACAREPDQALRVNTLGTKHVALACQQLHVPLMYISTNEVFSGHASEPYLEFDTPQPINPYAYSKWAGEQVIQQLLRRFYIVRVAWVFGGERNFVRTILRLARERGELSVVDDEIGNPTYALDLARAIARLIDTSAYGVFHLINEGHCSRFDFAQEIVHQAGIENVTINRIKLADYKRDSTPPAFGALRNFVGSTELDIQLRPWQDALTAFLSSIGEHRTA